MTTPLIRPALETDLPFILDIYNEAIARTVATFDTEPRTMERQQQWWAAHQSPRHPVLVAEVDGAVVGWASLSRWSDKAAYDGTAEISFYVYESQRGKGLGKLLLHAILKAGQKGGLHTVLALITAGNEVSLALHERLGFVHVGKMQEVGIKFDQLLDVHLLQKIYSK
ncbi:GNAT family N-acetyltransferase [Tumebacillus sp. DT12]|uniref:GNAT family N-acetyltransferase n=1 Tax=Tumebacillus lacus TaxID=2995335 RepID=A0ABT3X9H0_9BACL|nr:GNAT family N-acetyltransferase [Tumebacillus lacus]MCX7572260.1 GNAT family N-acetyltransferase [Tumebacillus lacus]